MLLRRSLLGGVGSALTVPALGKPCEEELRRRQLKFGLVTPAYACGTTPILWGGSLDFNFQPWAQARGFVAPYVADYFVNSGIAHLTDLPDAWNYTGEIGSDHTNHGVTVLWSIPMCGSADNSNTVFGQIAAGNFDNLWQFAVTSVVSAGAGSKVILRPGWEMNIVDFPWRVTSGNVTNFVAAWQRIYNVFHTQCAASGVQGEISYTPSSGASDTLWFSQIAAYCDSIGTDLGSVDYAGVPNNQSLSSTPVSVTTQLQRCKAGGKKFCFGELAGRNTSNGWYAVSGFLPNIVTAFQNNPGVPVSYVCFTDTTIESNVTFENDATSSSAVQSFMNSLNAMQPAG